MSEINSQALREAAEQAMHDDWGFDADLFHELVTPSIVLALLDERERNQQYIKRRDQENEEIALTVGKLRVELEEAKSKLNEQREYYEGVISDGSKRIAELEKSEEQLINERDHAESALADMYFATTGDRPEWSNCFSFSDAVYSAAIFLIPICISFDTAEKRRYATYLILNRRFSFEF
ncbi:hypothetical protein BvCmsSIP042_00962 [Escherichia coli]|nr:hypothetical protein BvCmsSIP042_00962 [Escherichia coli]